MGSIDIEVLVDDDIDAAIVSAIDQYDIVCVGLSQRTDGSRIVFGTITEWVAEEATGNVALVRGAAAGSE